jgi:nucleotide-binding universal stress UspA family protein
VTIVGSPGLNDIIMSSGMQKKRILVPLNFTSQSDAALHHAMSIAMAINGMITCLHVNEEPDFITAQFLSKEMAVKIRRAAEETLSVKVNKILSLEHKAPFELIVASGKVHEKIMEKAADLNASLIIMGKSDSEDIPTSHLGLNTKHIIAKAQIPVLTVCTAKHTGNNRILLPLDLSKEIEVKLLKAIEMARMLESAVFVFSVSQSDLASLKTLYQGRLQEIRQIFDTEGIPCDAHVSVSKNTIPEAILMQARKIDAGLIMMMTQQEKRFTDFFIGSTVQQIINETEIPVLSILPNVRTDAITDTPVWSKILNPIIPMQLN